MLIYAILFAGLDGLRPFASLAWDAIEALICTGLVVGLPVWFRERFNTESPIVAELSAAVFGVYIVHVFVLVGLQTAFLGVDIAPFAKFVAVTLLGTLASFATVVALRRIPFVKALF